METENGLNKNEQVQYKPNTEAIYAQATFTLPINVTTYIPIPLTSLFIPQDKPPTSLASPILSLSPTTPDFGSPLNIDSLSMDLPGLSILQPTQPETTTNTSADEKELNNNTLDDGAASNYISTTSDDTINNNITDDITNNTTLDNDTTNNSPTNHNNTTTPNGKEKRKKGYPSAKRGRKPAQDPPYTKLYRQPWLDGWATCRRLALEYIEEAKLMAQRANQSLSEVRRLPSQAELSDGNSKRAWTPMELILARAFLKEADLVSTSTKRGAVIRGDILMEQIPELISQSVLPATHAIHYLPKERKKDPNEPKKEKKPRTPKKQKTEPAVTLLPPPTQLSPFLQPLSVPKEPILFWKCE